MCDLFGLGFVVLVIRCSMAALLGTIRLARHLPTLWSPGKRGFYCTLQKTYRCLLTMFRQSGLPTHGLMSVKIKGLNVLIC